MFVGWFVGAFVGRLDGRGVGWSVCQKFFETFRHICMYIMSNNLRSKIPPFLSQDGLNIVNSLNSIKFS